MQIIITLTMILWLAYRCFALITTEQRTNAIMQQELRGDTNYILPPRYFVIPALGQIVISIIFTIIFLLCVYFSFAYIKSLAVQCDTILGINAILFVQTGLAIFTFIFTLTALLYYFATPKEIQRNSFSYKAVLDDKEIGKNRNNAFLITVFCALLIFNSADFAMDIHKELKVFKINMLNIIYQQKCEVREKPFDIAED